MQSLPNQPSHDHVHAPQPAAGRAPAADERIASGAAGQPSGATASAGGTLAGPGSLFLAGSRRRLVMASGLIAVLWLMVWWALD